ncbi:hypothetical protein [Paenibacillus cremeus]|uniref:Single-stranded DNA-binding protein n=1 Tax=Paenibacillus cremeus TaxID=2163881 RepID=A0A559KCM5_9BACL|nr:hypothetical protein [Paenibacillus cremeus]TVY09886.1 hypothetical protein FPZ49_10970 [Paenibacillus cremeus]
MAELKQTVGKIRIEGKIQGLEAEGAYREGRTKNGEGQPYRSISTSVKTSPTNTIYNIDLFGQVPNKKVKIFSNKNGNKQQMEIDFDERDQMPDGFTCFGFGTVGTGFEQENGRLKMKNYFNYDGVKAIKDNLHNDTPVWIDGEFNINTYESNGETKTNVKYTIARIGLKDEMDFDADNFKEVASFEQEFVVTEHQLDKEARKLYVGARIIGWDKTWKDITFVVDANKYETLANNVYKKTKFGDLLKVQGVIRSGVELAEVEEEPELNWGGETPTGQGKKAIRNKINELQITNVMSHTAKVYKEDDFIVDNPFEQSNALDIEDSDLPF